MLQAAIHGRLGRDPQPRHTSTGNPMTVASVAVDVTPHNTETEETLWVTVVTFGRLAEQLARHKKGEMLSAAGRLTLKRWTGNDGQERINWELTADSLVSARTVRPGGGKRKARQEHPAPEPAFDDDRLPF